LPPLAGLAPCAIADDPSSHEGGAAPPQPAECPKNPLGDAMA